MQQLLTPYQSLYCAWLLTRRAAADSAEEYVPDFVVETDAMIFMVETEARVDIGTQEVQSKAEAAACWCKHASDHTKSVGSKPWRYLLVPHDAIDESKLLKRFLQFEFKSPKLWALMILLGSWPGNKR